MFSKLPLDTQNTLTVDQQAVSEGVPANKSVTFYLVSGLRLSDIKIIIFYIFVRKLLVHPLCETHCNLCQDILTDSLKPTKPKVANIEFSSATLRVK